MKTITTYMMLPLSILVIGVLLLLIRIIPKSWRTMPMALLALLLTTIPAPAEPERMVTCYEPVAITQDDTETLLMTPEWTSFRNSYVMLLDYMAAAKFDETTFDKALADLNTAEATLNKSMELKSVSSKATAAVFDGMSTSSTGYERNSVGTTCYKMMISEEINRKFALADVVNRQVQLRQLLLQNTPVTPEAIKIIKASMFVDLEKYLTGKDLAAYKQLMLDLVQMPY